MAHFLIQLSHTVHIVTSLQDRHNFCVHSLAEFSSIRDKFSMLARGTQFERVIKIIETHCSGSFPLHGSWLFG